MVAYSFKRRFVGPIRVGLGIDIRGTEFWSPRIAVRPKRQTIRADRKRHARPGEELQLYCGMRTKGCFLIGRAWCIAVTPISIEFNPIHPIILVGGSPYRENLTTFAHNDGFENWKEMRSFWFKEHPGIDIFVGVLIKWVPL
jgi:hypothetical protein